jgi:hypothetical protein
MGHMAQSVCAGMLAAEGKIKVHNSNGTICAVWGQCVYLTCANSKDRIPNLGCGVFKVINKYTTNTCAGEGDKETPVTCFRRDCVHWVMLTEKDWGALNEKFTPQGQ